MNYEGWLEKENPFSGNDDDYDCQWVSKFMRKSYEAGERSQQEKIDKLQYILTEIEIIINDDGYMYETMIERITELLNE